MSSVKRLIAEIHRRSIWQVLLVYVGAAWACFELIDAVAERLALPAWLPGLAIILFLLGLPFVIATAFVREGAGSPLSTGEFEALPAEAKADELQRVAAVRRRRRILTWRNAAATVVVVLAAWGVLAAGWLVFAPQRFDVADSTIDTRPSVAALPFLNLSGLEEDAYFTNSIHGEILTRLQKIGGLKVLSRTSVMGYQDSLKNIREIGEELNARYILEGEILRAAQEVRVNVQLIDAQTDEHVWAEIYDRQLSVDNLLRVQSDIAQKIALALSTELTPEELERIEARPTENLDAYQAYLRGRYYQDQPHFTADDANRALREFERAAELDPNFALAQAELANAHARQVFFWVDASEARRQLATEWGNKAFGGDHASPEVSLAAGLYHLLLYRDTERAMEEIAIAERGLPDSKEIFEARSFVFETQGRLEDAIEQNLKALKVSPMDASIYTALSFEYWSVRRFEDAEAMADQAIGLAPTAMWPNLGKVFAIWSDRGASAETDEILERLSYEAPWVKWSRYWQRMFEDRYDDALELVAEPYFEWVSMKIAARPRALLAAWAASAAGEKEEADRLFEEARQVLERAILEHPNDPRYHGSLGIAYAALGRNEAALREGETAVALLPVSSDAVYGIPYLADLALIYVLIGDEDAALRELDNLLNIPSWISTNWLKIDPRFDSLNDNTRYRALLERHSRS
jgi:serine/threonine-protein kinase